MKFDNTKNWNFNITLEHNDYNFADSYPNFFVANYKEDVINFILDEIFLKNKIFKTYAERTNYDYIQIKRNAHSTILNRK